jgi:hypothetical protein
LRNALQAGKAVTSEPFWHDQEVEIVSVTGNCTINSTKKIDFILKVGFGSGGWNESWVKRTGQCWFNLWESTRAGHGMEIYQSIKQIGWLIKYSLTKLNNIALSSQKQACGTREPLFFFNAVDSTKSLLIRQAERPSSYYHGDDHHSAN